MSVLKPTNTAHVGTSAESLHSDVHKFESESMNNNIDANCNQIPVETDSCSNFSSEHVSTNTENTDSCLPSCSSRPNCISYSTDMKKIKSNVAVIQKQIKSSNNVIESTNSIINSISSLLETLLKEFDDKLNVKNEEIEK